MPDNDTPIPYPKWEEESAKLRLVLEKIPEWVMTALNDPDWKPLVVKMAEEPHQIPKNWVVRAKPAFKHISNDIWYMTKEGGSTLDIAHALKMEEIPAKKWAEKCNDEYYLVEAIRIDE